MNGGRIAKTGRLLHILIRQPNGQVAAVVPDGEPTAVGDVGDGSAVAVLDPVSGGESEASVIGAGDDHIADTGLVSVC